MSLSVIQLTTYHAVQRGPFRANWYVCHLEILDQVEACHFLKSDPKDFQFQNRVG